MGLLALKLTLAPGLVVAATLAGRRWGERMSGILIALPLVAGPILLIVTLQEGRDFGARAARGSLLGIVALSAFCVVFARASERPWSRALLTGWSAFALVGLAVSGWDAPPLLGLAAALLALALARRALGREEPARIASSAAPPAWDLYARAGATAGLVVAITTAADALGPALSGVLTPFPIATSVLAAFTLAHRGPEAARTTLRGFVAALPGFALCCFLVAVLLG